MPHFSIILFTGYTTMSNVWGRYTLALLLSSICITGLAQETKGKRTARSAEAEPAEERITGRLPRHFAAIVDDSQRIEIYEIQASYREQIRELEQQLAEVEQAQMKEIEEVLTSTQRKALGELRDTASKGSSKSAASTSKSSGKSSSKKTSSKSSSRRTTGKSSASKSPSTKSSRSSAKKS